MKLYRPVLIESVEQAEALPEGTVIIHAEYYPQEKFDGLWGREGNSSASLAEEEGWSALVPVEAEEELVERSRLCQKDPDVLHRYVTGWQHYTAKEQNR